MLNFTEDAHPKKARVPLADTNSIHDEVTLFHSTGGAVRRRMELNKRSPL